VVFERELGAAITLFWISTTTHTLPLYLPPRSRTPFSSSVVSPVPDDVPGGVLLEVVFSVGVTGSAVVASSRAGWLRKSGKECEAQGFGERTFPCRQWDLVDVVINVANLATIIDVAVPSALSIGSHCH